MRDKRRDSGEYYPGGRVIARPGTAPQQVVVQWSDVQNKPQIAPLPERYRDSDVKTKINEIASKFATVVVAAFVVWTACADVTVQKKRKDEIYNDELVVVDVSGGGGGGAAKMLPKYLHAIDFGDSYQEDAEWYYGLHAGEVGRCSVCINGLTASRNYDWKFDDAAEFVIRVKGAQRFSSIGVASVGTNLTEQFVTSGKHSRYYKCLPGMTLDGMNENGIFAAVNVCSTNGIEGWRGDPSTGIHCLAAVRRVLDFERNVSEAASNLAERIYVPASLGLNFHYVVADQRETWIVENGVAYKAEDGKFVMTNFRLYPTPAPITEGEGHERYEILQRWDSSITDVRWTNAYQPSANPWYSDIGTDTQKVWTAWASKAREEHRGETVNGKSWWQTVHTSIYDLAFRTLRIAVQEKDDWYTFDAWGVGRNLSGLLPSSDPVTGSFVSWDNGSLAVGDGACYVANNHTMQIYSDFKIYQFGHEVHALSKKADRADIPVISAADPTFSNAVKAVMEVRDVPKNLKYTITADNDRFYFTPTGAINPED